VNPLTFSNPFGITGGSGRYPLFSFLTNRFEISKKTNKQPQNEQHEWIVSLKYWHFVFRRICWQKKFELANLAWMNTFLTFLVTSLHRMRPLNPERTQRSFIYCPDYIYHYS
jgi:hypothetical protein